MGNIPDNIIELVLLGILQLRFLNSSCTLFQEEVRAVVAVPRQTITTITAATRQEKRRKMKRKIKSMTPKHESGFSYGPSLWRSRVDCPFILNQ